jgi:hypothetical protein
LKHGNAISCILSTQICSKIYANYIVVFEIKEGKSAQKVKKNINRNLSLLIGGIIPRKYLKFETRKCYFLHFEHPKNKNIINNNL